MENVTKHQISIVEVPLNQLRPADYNPRKWDSEAVESLKQSIKSFGVVDPIIVNSAPNRQGVIIGGHFRFHVVKELGFKEIPVVYINIPDLEKDSQQDGDGQYTGFTIAGQKDQNAFKP